MRPTDWLCRRTSGRLRGARSSVPRCGTGATPVRLLLWRRLHDAAGSISARLPCVRLDTGVWDRELGAWVSKSGVTLVGASSTKEYGGKNETRVTRTGTVTVHLSMFLCIVVPPFTIAFKAQLIKSDSRRRTSAKQGRRQSKV